MRHGSNASEVRWSKWWAAYNVLREAAYDNHGMNGVDLAMNGLLLAAYPLGAAFHPTGLDHLSTVAGRRRYAAYGNEASA